jgi:hypothetical protein
VRGSVPATRRRRLGPLRGICVVARFEVELFVARQADGHDAGDAAIGLRLRRGQHGQRRSPRPAGQHRRRVGRQGQRSPAGLEDGAIALGDVVAGERRVAALFDLEQRSRAESDDRIPFGGDHPEHPDGGAEPAPVAAGIEHEREGAGASGARTGEMQREHLPVERHVRGELSGGRLASRQHGARRARDASGDQKRDRALP